MDKETPSTSHLQPGISLRNGPMDDMDLDEPLANGVANGKRKSRGSITQKSYKVFSDSEDDSDAPLVTSRLSLDVILF